MVQISSYRIIVAAAPVLGTKDISLRKIFDPTDFATGPKGPRSPPLRLLPDAERSGSCGYASIRARTALNAFYHESMYN